MGSVVTPRVLNSQLIRWLIGRPRRKLTRLTWLVHQGFYSWFGVATGIKKNMLSLKGPCTYLIGYTLAKNVRINVITTKCVEWRFVKESRELEWSFNATYLLMRSIHAINTMQPTCWWGQYNALHSGTDQRCNRRCSFRSWTRWCQECIHTCNCLTLSWHVPLYWQGLDWHSSISVSHRAPWNWSKLM